MERSGPQLTRSLKRAQAAPRDSFSSCSKVRTFVQSLTTERMRKKCKQKLERKVPQSPCTLPMVREYQCLAFPVKENGNSFHFNVSCDMPSICKHAQISSNSVGVCVGFHRLLLRMNGPGPYLSNMDVTHSQV
jgi:hypothetical protein